MRRRCGLCQITLTIVIIIIIIKLHRSTTYVDSAYCYRPSSVVCRSVTLVSPTKTAEPLEMPFGLRSRVGPRNHVLDGGQHLPIVRGNFEGEKGRPIVKYRHSAVVCAKTAESIDLPFGLWTQRLLIKTVRLKNTANLRSPALDTSNEHAHYRVNNSSV